MKDIINILDLIEEIEDNIYHRANNIIDELIETDIVIDLLYRKYILLYLELNTISKTNTFLRNF
tara:strand:- start:104 stop:295 length:192 start_codon:yes stop_codon:yes gene_type:complete